MADFIIKAMVIWLIASLIVTPILMGVVAKAKADQAMVLAAQAAMMAVAATLMGVMAVDPMVAVAARMVVAAGAGVTVAAVILAMTSR